MSIRATISLALSVLALSACTGMGGPRDRYDYLLKPVANPSEVVATELAFARAAQEDGQWAAFREYSTDDAVMFVPQSVNAHEWLAQQNHPEQPLSWEPHHVWSSCDGSLAVTRGAWQQPDGTFGYFTTVWERQDNGEYKWVMDQGDVRDAPLPAPAMIGTTVASCTTRPDDVAFVDFVEGATVGGKSRDGTLHWSVTVQSDKSRRVRISYWDGAVWQLPIDNDAGG